METMSLEMTRTQQKDGLLHPAEKDAWGLPWLVLPPVWNSVLTHSPVQLAGSSFSSFLSLPTPHSTCSFQPPFLPVPVLTFKPSSLQDLSSPPRPWLHCPSGLSLRSPLPKEACQIQVHGLKNKADKQVKLSPRELGLLFLMTVLLETLASF